MRLRARCHEAHEEFVACKIPGFDGDAEYLAAVKRIVVAYCFDIAMRPSRRRVFWTVGSSSAMSLSGRFAMGVPSRRSVSRSLISCVSP